QPPPAMEEEFQDWYDTEHFPERQNCEGFVTAQRLLCLDGFPRYLALYDLSDRAAVMNGPAYGAIARDRYSQWTKRIIPRMWGHYRAEAEQIFPGDALFGAKGMPARVVLWRFAGAPVGSAEAIVAGAQASFAGTEGVRQLRVFQSVGEERCDFIVTVELAGVVPLPAPRALGNAAQFLNLTNVYTPYWR
ncbi:MAG: DUF4286 family protein, partial [Acetobacteraceae bacterium]